MGGPIKRAVILGAGYVGRPVATALCQRGWEVTGTTRSRPEQVAASGAMPLLWPGPDGETPAELIAAIGRADVILQAAGPIDARGGHVDPALADMGDAIAASAASWVGYYSATSVYPDKGGNWVDEDTPPAPGSARGKARLKAETEWRDATKAPLAILRLAGIYGPGRNPLKRLIAGQQKRIIKRGQVFSRIHLDDIVAITLAAIAREQGGVFNLCDDLPTPPQEVIEHVCAQTGLPLPPAIDFDTADMSPMIRSFYSESKRIRNARAKAVLGWQPIHPDYRSGMAPLIAGHNLAQKLAASAEE